jgi:hypothetical protein
MIAACFAIGSVGFFLAVLLQHTSASSSPVVGEIQPVAAELSTSTKEQILESLDSSSSGAGASASTSSSATSSAASSNAQTAAKLKILESLNAH